MCDSFVFMDESGQTYYNYLDPDQTYFAYGGLRTSESEASVFKSKYFNRIAASELHYVQMRKTGVGRSCVKEFLAAERTWIKANFKWFLIDKRYALLAKYVDLLIEPETADLGDNLYSGGAAQRLVYALHHTARATTGEAALSELMTAFSSFCREPDLDKLSELERVARTTSVGDEYLDFLLRMPFMRSGTTLLESMEPNQLDLTFTAARNIADSWYREIKEPYFLIHDESAALASQSDVWGNMTREELGYVSHVIGPHEVPSNVPLKETIFVPSSNCVPLQIVDVIVGVSRALVEWFLKGRPENPFLTQVEVVFGIQPPDRSILPINDPSDLPMDDQSVDELNAILDKVAKRRDGK